MWSYMSFVKRPKSSPKKTRPTFIEPLILEKRPNNLFDTMREYNMRPAYSPPKIRPLNKDLEELLTFLYIFLNRLHIFIFKKSLFFDCSKKFSRCHFLKGFAK